MEKRSYPQIEGHPSEMTHEQAANYDRPVMVGYQGEVKMCMLKGYSYHEYDYTVSERGKEEDFLGDKFCDFADAEAIRKCTSFDF